MAHYTAAVISKDLKDVERLLYPHGRYNIEGEIIYNRQELIERGRKELEDFNRYIYSNYLIDKDNFSGKNKYYPDFLNYVEKVFEEQYKCTDEELYAEILKSIYPVNLDHEGNVHLDYDPDRKYARYSLGNETKHIHAFRNSDGGMRMDYQGLIKDLIINRKAEIQERKSYEEYWKRITNWYPEEMYLKSIGIKRYEEEEAYFQERECKKQYLLDTYGDFENYLKHMVSVYTEAVVTPDGVWHENTLRNCLGEVSYAIGDNKEWIENYQDDFLKKYEECYITFIICTDY